MTNIKKYMYSTALVAALSISPAMADHHNEEMGMAEATTEKLNVMNDGSNIAMTGQVGEIRNDEFDLHYGYDDNTNRMITVELDKFGWTGNETRYLSAGENVTVYGFIDDDLFEGREVEAYQILLNDSFVTYSYDTSDLSLPRSSYSSPEDGSYVTASGIVTDVDGEEFTVSDGTNTIRVEANDLGYDPFDNDGFQKIENGDRVYVYGELDKDFFESNEIDAERIIEYQSFDSAM